jgi:DNA-binding SARP family transcriptional activator
LRFSILGPLEIHDGESPVTVAARKQRVTLGLLLCRANRIVSVDALSDALWDATPPRTAHKNLQVYVSALRKLVERDSSPTRLTHTPPGYTIHIGPNELDALRANDLAAAGRLALRGGEVATAVELLGQAVRLWRGPVLPDLVAVPSIAAEARRLGEHHLGAYEDWGEAKLALGHHLDLTIELDELVRRHPLRERLRYVHLLALYRSGRQTEALSQYEGLRQRLARELGLAPSPALTRLYESILASDPGLDGSPLSRAAPIAVRTATGPSGLARDITDFTGRTAEVARLLGALDAAGPGAVLTIHGPTGVGKTTLAVHCAHRRGDRFADGRVLVPMRHPDGARRPVVDVLADAVRALAVAGVTQPDEAEAAALLRESTRGRRVLVLLDDAADEAQVRPVLAATGEAVVVITSRRRLGGLESAAHLPLAPMPEPDIVALLARLAGAERVAAEPAGAAGRRASPR